MKIPFHAGAALEAKMFADVRLRTIFQCCKWDPQVEDSSVLAGYPLVLERAEWERLANWAEILAAETVAAENELLERPESWDGLGLPRKIRKALGGGRPAKGCARVMRFDFHWTSEGWRISEVNSDVPGGYIEASGFTGLMAEAHPGYSSTGDPAAALAEALAKSEETAVVAMVHATAYSDDRQVMCFLAGYLEKVGLKAVLVSPDQIKWRDGEGWIECDWFRGRADLIYRFYPAEWLPNLDSKCGWGSFFSGANTLQSNPGWALLSQSKRFGLLVREKLSCAPTWRELLPETRDPREVKGVEEWVFKPALGRVGDGIGIAGVTSAKEWRQIRRSVFFFPRWWVAQKRFDCLPVMTPDGPRYFCLGVYTINGRAAGTYCRGSATPIINHLAQDVAVLISNSPGSNLL